MALTRDFKETIRARAQRHVRFRQVLFTEAIGAYLAGDTSTGKAVLRDLVNATVGFAALAAAVNKSPKSLHRMLARPELARWPSSKRKPGSTPAASTSGSASITSARKAAVRAPSRPVGAP